MKSLLNKNQSLFLSYIIMILIICAPVFFFFMKFFYTKDLDELIIYRCNEFIHERLPEFEESEISTYNYYNEDIKILPFDRSYMLDKTTAEFLYNKAEGHNIDYRIIYKKITVGETPYILMSRIPMIENKDMLLNLVAQYGVIFIILIISLFVVQHFLARRLWKPFNDTLRKIENYTLEQESVPDFGETDIIEFDKLNNILTTLISKNLGLYKQQKEFIENASHELQTPLALFQSKLDMLIQDENLTKEQSEAVTLLYESSSRMTRLNKNLLLLARIGNSQYKEVKELSFNKTLNKQLFFFKSIAENNGLDFSVDNKLPVMVNANPVLLDCLISNLIVNAINHNRENGKISVIVDKGSFSVYNTGEEKPLSEERLFKRFSRNIEKKGNGLGLSIVAQICRFHHWTVDYGYEKQLHRFTVRF